MESNLFIALTWEDISGHYIDITHDGADQMPMVNLVQHIIEKDFSKRLFAFVSSNTLIISKYNPIDPFKNALHIEFKDTTFMFICYGKRFQHKLFERQFTEEQCMSKLDNVIHQSGW